MIKFQCECGRKIAAPDQWLGKRVRCPQCGKPVLVQESLAMAPVVPTPRLEPAPPPEPKHESAVADSGRAPGSAGISESDDDGESQFGIKRDSAHRPPSLTPEASAGKAEGPDEREETDDPFEDIPPVINVSPRKVFVAPNAPPMEYIDQAPTPGGRAPLILGLLGLLAGCAGAALYWVPTVEWYVSPAVGGVGVFLALVGVILSLRRERHGLLLPILATLVSALAVSLPWLLPVVQDALSRPIATPTTPTTPTHDWTLDKKDDIDESMRKMVVAVDSIRLVGGKDGPTGVLEYKLTNKSSKPIKLLEGSIQLYDKDHKFLGALSLDASFEKSPLVPGASTNGKNTWPMDASVEQSLADSQATAEYRAQSVTYADGSQEKFDK